MSSRFIIYTKNPTVTWLSVLDVFIPKLNKFCLEIVINRDQNPH